MTKKESGRWKKNGEKKVVKSKGCTRIRTTGQQKGTKKKKRGGGRARSSKSSKREQTSIHDTPSQGWEKYERFKTKGEAPKQQKEWQKKGGKRKKERGGARTKEAQTITRSSLKIEEKTQEGRCVGEWESVHQKALENGEVGTTRFGWTWNGAPGTKERGATVEKGGPQKEDSEKKNGHQRKKKKKGTDNVLSDGRPRK